MRLQWRTVHIPATVYKLVNEEAEKCGLTENRMVTKILADRYGVKVKLPKFQKYALGAPSEAMDTPLAGPSEVVPEDVAPRSGECCPKCGSTSRDQLGELCVSTIDDAAETEIVRTPNAWHQRAATALPFCPIHNYPLIDYGTEWYCLAGNHAEPKNA